MKRRLSLAILICLTFTANAVALDLKTPFDTPNLAPAPTGHEYLLNALDASGGEMEEVVVEQVIEGITYRMWLFWMFNMADYYRIWCPLLHFDAVTTTSPSGEMRVLIKEMIWPYYTELYADPKDGTTYVLDENQHEVKVASLVHKAIPTPRGIKLRSTLVIPKMAAEKPDPSLPFPSFKFAFKLHVLTEMQDLKRFLPELYHQNTGK
ncbi:MAG: hypothetical protein HKP58_08885 [Desulfatitalea sp.]|nr:hypothetical protein [Desulfatitalea sp.]NNK00514.1 hypothetical protein [Desulfatitalea sp.]